MGDTSNLTIGRGRLYFDQFDVNGNKTGERYFGNTPKADIAIANTMLDHFDSDDGLKLKDASIILESEITFTLDTDNINADNLALWFLGAVDDTTVAGASGLSETIAIGPNLFYQLGTSANPSGVRNVGTVTIHVGTQLVPTSEYDVDDALARVFIHPDSAHVTATSSGTIGFAQLAYQRETVIAEGLQITGALRYISNNPAGPNRDIYIPKCQLTSDGTFSLKGETWQVMSFKVEVLLPADGSPRLYADNRVVA